MIKTGRRQYSIEESIAAFYAVELINMVCRLHQCHVIHGDIKPDNIMIMDIRSVHGEIVCTLRNCSNNGKCAKSYIQYTTLLHTSMQTNCDIIFTHLILCLEF